MIKLSSCYICGIRLPKKEFKYVDTCSQECARLSHIGGRLQIIQMTMNRQNKILDEFTQVMKREIARRY
jgi:hypothetical protein